MKRRIRKIKRHLRRWNGWRKCNGNSKLIKFLVLLNLWVCPTFEMFLLPEERPNYKTIFYENDKFCSVSEVKTKGE